MEAQEFKTKIKEVKDLLKGKTIQFITKNSVRPYTTLREFGEAILEQEKYGQSFSIGQIWTVDGIEYVKSFQDLVNQLKSGVVTALQVRAYYAPKNECEYMRSFGSLD
jgi:hypothetical protein